MPTMAHTNVYMNWTGVTITPAGGSAITLLEVLDVQILDEDTIEPWQSDGNKFPTVLVAASGMRGLTIVGGDIFKLAGIARNTLCTIVAVLNDARNAAASGAITHTLTNAMFVSSPRSGTTNKFAGGSVTFIAASADGTTDPLSITQAT